MKALLEGLSDAPSLIACLQGVERGLILHGHLHRRVQQELATREGSLTSVGATSASLHHENEARFAGYNVYEVDDGGRVARIEAHVFEPGTETFRLEPVPPHA
jgi:hypothetical protein